MSQRGSGSGCAQNGAVRDPQGARWQLRWPALEMRGGNSCARVAAAVFFFLPHCARRNGGWKRCQEDGEDRWRWRRRRWRGTAAAAQFTQVLLEELTSEDLGGDAPGEGEEQSRSRSSRGVRVWAVAVTERPGHGKADVKSGMPFLQEEFKHRIRL
ncbi:unnamed protein product [Prorocentrum cordatum]|uniref:Uncharacterized protein n=1 Tax=Prorocentrum cordatum TaxID=2364126 RepID=A0ABN9UMA5_9DINO|nr:unnamed protein product [Polarella glacialis]